MVCLDDEIWGNEMILLQILILLLWLVLVPAAAGGIISAGSDKRLKSFFFMWTGGTILLWAVFQLICVPAVLLQQRFDGREMFPVVVALFLAVSLLLAALGMGLTVRSLLRSRPAYRVLSGMGEKKGRMYYVLWALFWLLLLFQLVQAVRLAYADGDDAYYVAVSAITQESNTMYMKRAYTGGRTGLETRYGLAPFPIWISFLARISGLKAVSVAHVAAPLCLISLTYAIYYLIGRRLCGRKNGERLPLFLLFTELLVLFGDYSIYTAENFMLARSRQGKAALGNIILPMLILLLFIILERLQENEKTGFHLWLLLAACITAGCLCSTLGALLCCMLVGVTGICAAVSYRRWKILLPMILCCIPAVCFAGLYLVL